MSNYLSTVLSRGAPYGAPSRKQQSGFTLIELMIAVGIVAILVGIAWPLYSRYVVKTRRAVAAGCVIEAAQFMERYYTTNMSYVDKTGAAPVLPPCSAEITKFYTFKVDGVTARDYNYISATPTSLQKDPNCGELRLNRAGMRTVTGTSNNANECW